MAGSRILIDSDVFLILAGSGLLERALELLGFEVGNARRLDALPHMIRKSARLYHTYPADYRDNADTMCQHVAPILEAPPGDGFDRLLGVEEIDEGEAFMYAHLTAGETWLLASGDKRAMRALAADPSVAGIRDAVAGRVICLETIFRALVEADGAQQISAQLRGMRGRHATVTVVFSDVNAVDTKECLGAIDAYLKQLKAEVGPGFLYEP